mgnify:CR=1 FL=1
MNANVFMVFSFYVLARFEEKNLEGIPKKLKK